MECCVNGRFENCEVRNYENYAHRVDHRLTTVYDNPFATNPKGRKSAHDEPLQVAHSRDSTTNNPRVHKCRCGIDFANGVFEVENNNSYITGVSMYATSTHGESATAGNIYVDGGLLEADCATATRASTIRATVSRSCVPASRRRSTVRRSARPVRRSAPTATR